MHSLTCIEWTSGNAGRLVLSTDQALTRHRKSDDEAFWLPLSRDFASEPAGHGRPDEKLAESMITVRGSDRWPAQLCPNNHSGFRTSSALDSNPPDRRGKRAILYGVCREFVQQQREVRDHRSRNLHIATDYRKPATLALALVGRENRLDERMQRRLFCSSRRISGPCESVRSCTRARAARRAAADSTSCGTLVAERPLKLNTLIDRANRFLTR
jgi:hypothetical protein